MFPALALFLRRLFLMVFALSLSFPASAAGWDEQRIDVGGYKLNSVLLKADHPKLPPIVFIHGASTSLYDPVLSFRQKLEGQADLLFVDRPGHGGSDRGGARNAFPDGQADAIAVLMRKRGITRAIIVGHSFGGAVEAAFALRHPDMVIGLLFLSPALYPWTTGLEWYYELAKNPVSGWLFSSVVVPPLGLFMIHHAVKTVFAPNPVPPDYLADAHAYVALKPSDFHYNAEDLSHLSDWARKTAPLYKTIRKPTIIIVGDRDHVADPKIHGEHLARDIEGARLFVIHNLGHKSDYVAGDLAVAAIETLAGGHPDLAVLQRSLERKIAADDELTR